MIDPKKDQYPKHTQDEEFDPKNFPYDELLGPLFGGPYFDPHRVNIYRGRPESNTHHSSEDGIKTRKHFKSIPPVHFYCLEWIDHPDPDIGRVRCGHQYCVKSGGCGNKTHGFTKITDTIKDMKIGDRIKWGVFMDPKALEEEGRAPEESPEEIERKEDIAAMNAPDPEKAFQETKQSRAWKKKTARQDKKDKAQQLREATGKTKTAKKALDQEATLGSSILTRLEQLDLKATANKNSKKKTGTKNAKWRSNAA